MKVCYEKPEAELILFRSLQDLAIIEDEVKDSEAGAIAHEHKLEYGVKRCKNTCKSLYKLCNVTVTDVPVNVCCLE